MISSEEYDQLTSEVTSATMRERIEWTDMEMKRGTSTAEPRRSRTVGHGTSFRDLTSDMEAPGPPSGGTRYPP